MGIKYKAAAMFFFILLCVIANGADARIIKVLPHYIDKEGRNATSPNLFERDSYQHYLMKNPDKCYGVRFDVQWKAKNPQGLKLKIEMRGSKDNAAQIFTIEKPLKKESFFGNWTTLTINGDEFKKMGMLLAWRATLWDGDKLLSEQKSFLY